MRNTQTIYNVKRGAASLKCKLVAVSIAVGIAIGGFMAESVAAVALSNQPYSKDMAKFSENGLISYSRWKKNPDGLQKYLSSLATMSREEFDALSHDEQKALWINAYNAFTIKLVLDHYPIHGNNKDFPADSFRQIPDAWENAKFKVASREVTLDEIEHTILRRDFHDSRTHFVIVCAAKGSPHLINHMFNASTLDADLDKAKSDYLTDERNISFDPTKKILKVSRLFQWFPLDFACAEWFKRNKGKLPNEESVIIEYLQKHGSEKVQKELTDAAETVKTDAEKKPVTVEYKDFDWSLNDHP